jgi:hypothetical protein
MADDRLTQPGSGDVRAFLHSVPDQRRRTDALAVLELRLDYVDRDVLAELVARSWETNNSEE